jgi:hypothetical protein
MKTTVDGGQMGDRKTRYQAEMPPLTPRLCLEIPGIAVKG